MTRKEGIFTFGRVELGRKFPKGKVFGQPCGWWEKTFPSKVGLSRSNCNCGMVKRLKFWQRKTTVNGHLPIGIMLDKKEFSRRKTFCLRDLNDGAFHVFFNYLGCSKNRLAKKMSTIPFFSILTRFAKWMNSKAILLYFQLSVGWERTLGVRWKVFGIPQQTSIDYNSGFSRKK